MTTANKSKLKIVSVAAMFHVVNLVFEWPLMGGM